MKTNQNTTPENNASPSGCPTTSRIMFELWEHNAKSFSKEQLEWFAGATEHAGMLTNDLQDILNGLGCLIADDGLRHEEKTNGGHCSGNFQSHHDVPTLLFFIARSLDNIQGLIEVGDSARHRLARPEMYDFEKSE